MMTEAEWMTLREPWRMLNSLSHQQVERKLWLFATACCHRVGHLFGLPGSRSLVEASEQRADGLLTEDEWRDAVCHLPPIRESPDGPGASPADRADFAAGQLLLTEPVEAAREASFQAFAAMQLKEGPQAPWAFYDQLARPFVFQEWPENHPERGLQADIIRDIFGNPFRPVTFDPAWLTSTVTALATQMYESRDFAAMPILADALQDAGCDNEEVLTHCRGPGPHVRGCWVVDRILGK